MASQPVTLTVSSAARRFPTVPSGTAAPYRESRRAWDAYRIENGRAPGAPFLSVDVLKLAKSEVPVLGLSLAPALTSGILNTCPCASPQCRAACLATAGNGRYRSVGDGRILRTRFYVDYPAEFVGLVVGEVDRFLAAHRDAPRVGFRPNVLSDIPWEVVAPDIVAPRPRLRAYDYSKVWSRDPAPELRYHLTLSRDERTPDAAILAAVASGRNVAVPFSTTRTGTLPRTFLGVRVHDGDRSDYRPRDPRGVIVGLRAKGDGRADTFRGGFVVSADDPRCA